MLVAQSAKDERKSSETNRLFGTFSRWWRFSPGLVPLESLFDAISKPIGDPHRTGQIR
jgi:hypothetical protein